MPKLNDESLMWFGTHKGKALANIPDSWFRWMYDQGKLAGPLLEYAKDNFRDISLSEEKKIKK